MKAANRLLGLLAARLAVNEKLISLWVALLIASQAAAATNAPVRPTNLTSQAAARNDAAEKEYDKLLADDDAAQTEVDKWIKENNAFADKGAGIPAATLNARIQQRFEPIIQSYEDFVQRHPEHAKARLAFGSFLNDIGRETDAMVQWERARQIDPKNPAAWNNLANYFSHNGPVKKSFEYFAKAIELSPGESVYYQNLATCVFLFRKDALEHYKFDDEQKVFRRALELYRQARKLDPENFALATDLAQTYYYLKAPKSTDQQATQTAEKQLLEEACAAWLDAQKLAHDDLEREGIFIHLARVNLTCGRFDETRRHLAAVTNPSYDVIKKRLLRNLEEKETKGKPAKE